MRLKFHPQAYVFVSEALKVAQDSMGRIPVDGDEQSAHITGPELLNGVRILGCRSFGMLAPDVFSHWGLSSTLDFGRLVFDLIERGEMRKTEQDQLEDFDKVYEFSEVFGDKYQFDFSRAFRRNENLPATPKGHSATGPN
jgi:uncharacterized repeat protein (TIGR04138 family)